MRATYYISVNGTDYTQIYPSNDPKVKLEQEAGEIFFRWRVDSFKIGATLNASVYSDLLHYFFTPVHFGTDINYRIQENGATTFEFIGPILKGKIDSQNSIYECTPDPDDEYRPVLMQYEKKWDNRTANTLFGESENVYYPAIGTGTWTNVSFSTWSELAKSVSWTNTVFGATQTARITLGTVAEGYNVIVRIMNHNLVAGNDPKVQLINTTSGASVSNQETISGNGSYTLTKNAVCANTSIEFSEVNQLPDAGVASGSFTYDYYDCSTNIGSGSLFRTVLDNCINGASYMNLAIGTVYSTILWNDAVESDAPSSISTYMSAHPTYDYVRSAAAIYNYLWLARADGPATTNLENIQVSLKDMMQMLRKLRMYWFIDADSHFRIEHEKYFRSYTTQADLTSSTYTADKPETDSKIYAYSKNESYCQINYSENNQKTEDWVPYPVEFAITKVTSSKLDVGFLDLTTDVKNMIENPDSANNNGLLLLRATYNTVVYTIGLDQSTLTAANYWPNAYLAWSYIIKYYQNYFAEADTGTINGGAAHSYTHVKEFLTQDNIRFHIASVLNWKKPVATVHGTAWLTTAEYAPETGMITINVAYNPYA